YWTSKARELPNVIVNTPVQDERACGIANVGIKNMAPKELADRLMKEYRIWTVAINRPDVLGCRISPNVYTTTKELDVLVRALEEMS
ncbi:MAG: aminotransferase, partial [Lewinella sp.]|nr:aminotransferase [Lewinella sp.]